MKIAMKQYNTKLDSKHRFTVRGANYDYYHVVEFEDGKIELQPRAGRIFWVYAPNKMDITVVGIEPHPEDKKKGGYKKIKLSDC